jgi:hypothetical protein
MADENRPESDVFDRLTPAARHVIAHAEGIRQRRSANKIHMEDLVAALFESGGEKVRERFVHAAYVSRGTFTEALGAELTSIDWTEVTPVTFTSPPPRSRHAAAAIEQAGRRAASIDSLALLGGALDQRRCHVVRRLRSTIREIPFQGRRPNLAAVNDDAVSEDEDDLLDLRDYADAIAGLIDSPKTTTSLTISISAPWGAGKTTLAKMVRKRLERKPAAGGDAPHVICWFNAWLHDEATDLSAAFAAAVARTADAYRPWWRRLVSPLPASMLPHGKRLRRRLVVGVLTLGATAVLTWSFAPSLAEMLLDEKQSAAVKALLAGRGSVGVFGAVYVFLAFVQHAWGAANAITTFVSSPGSAASAGATADARDQLSRLVRQATPRGSRFVVFVDDLERCRPPRPIEVLEVINQFLGGADVVTVLIADLPAVAACADIKYAALARASYSPDAEQQAREKTPHQLSYGWHYLQKIVQLRFDLPSYKREHMMKLLGEFAIRPDTARQDEPAPDAQAAGPSSDGATTETKPQTPLPVEKPTAVVPWERAFATPWPRDIGLGRRLREVIGARPWPQRVWLLLVSLPCLPAVALAHIAESAAYPVPRRSEVSFKRTYYRATEHLRVGLPMVATAAVAVVFWVRPGLLTPTYIATIAGTAMAGLMAVMGGIAGVRRRGDRQLVASVRSGREGKDVFGRIFEAERRYLALDDDSEMLRSASTEALKHVAPLPRTSKRLLNDLRLMLFIASHRRMFEANEGIAPVHFGKWAALRERWPHIARHVVTRPALLAGLENPKTTRREGKTVGANPASDPELFSFLATEPQLGDVIDRMVRYESPQNPPA